MSEVEALRAALESRDAQLSRQNAGLVQMARERDAALAELSAMRDAASDSTRVDPHGWARIRELESERDFVRRTAANRALELRDVWRMVTGEPLADDEVPMVIMAVRLMVERHNSFKASTERLSAETVDLRAALASVTAEVKRLKLFEAAELQRRAIIDTEDPATVGQMLAQVEALRPGQAVSIVDRLRSLPGDDGRRFAVMVEHDGAQTVATGPTRGAALVAAKRALAEAAK